MGESQDKEKIFVMVADDEENLLILLKDNLEERGFEVSVAVNGEEALKRLSEHRPNIIILDVEMPKLNGWQVCERIRATPELKDIPVIILSAYAQPEHVKRGMQAGANLYMSKPFKMDELVGNLRRLLGK